MAVEEEVAARRSLWRDVCKADASAVKFEVKDLRPGGMRVAIAANPAKGGGQSAELVENPSAADIPEMPDLIGTSEGVEQMGGKAVMGVSEDGHAGGWWGTSGGGVRSRRRVKTARGAGRCRGRL
jgi:hypothetical protein